MNSSINLNADLLILGSGGGLIAAVAAAERGVSNIVILEKQGIAGGNTRMANGFFACESPVQKRMNITAQKDYFFRLAMQWNHCDRVDPKVVKAYIDISGDTISWLEEKGVEFEDIIPEVAHDPTGHRPVGLLKKMQEIMLKEAEKSGVKIMLHTSANKIRRSPDSEILEVIASGEQGGQIVINSRSVIIATGGFAGNTAMLKKYCVEYHDQMYTGNWPSHTGDGLVIAEETGAAIAESIPLFHSGPVPENGPWGSLAGVFRYQPQIWVNSNGKRFIDESYFSVYENGNLILQQPGGIMYAIFDDKMRKSMEQTGLLEDINKDSNKSDQLKRFGSWEEMSKWIGSDYKTLKNTVDEYNNAYDNGYDPEFFKSKEFLLPLATPPFYAIKGLVDCGETMGGIKVNEFMEVLDNEKEVIPGIYAAGVIADGWGGQTYYSNEMGGCACGFAVNSGRIAGNSAASFLLK